MPEDEKRKLIKLYENIKLDEKLISDLELRLLTKDTIFKILRYIIKNIT